MVVSSSRIFKYETCQHQNHDFLIGCCRELVVSNLRDMVGILRKLIRAEENTGHKIIPDAVITGFTIGRP